MQLFGCATLPDAKKEIAKAELEDTNIVIENANKVLSERAVDKTIKKLTPEEEIRKSLENHLKVEQSISESVIYADNDVKVLFNGEETFKAMHEMLSSATETINLEYFIFEDIQFEEESLKDLLRRKLKEGVRVNINYDAYGSEYTPDAFFQELKAAGSNVQVFRPLSVWHLLSINNRNHRKIMVVDGRVAIIGGVNLSKTYESGGSNRLGSGRNKAAESDSAHWRDTDAVIKGPAVAELQRIFVEDWIDKDALDQTDFFPKLDKQGHELVRAVASNSRDDDSQSSLYYLTLISAIENANRSIVINSGYFVPNRAQMKALIDASKRGVKVDLLLPGLSDSKLALNVQRSRYIMLLDGGVNIYELQDEVLHAKVVSIDGVWSVIGSSNFDYRSAGLNSEIDMVILGEETSKDLVSRFNHDLANATKISLEEWKNRPISDKLKQFLSRLFEGFL